MLVLQHLFEIYLNEILKVPFHTHAQIKYSHFPSTGDLQPVTGRSSD